MSLRTVALSLLLGLYSCAYCTNLYGTPQPFGNRNKDIGPPQAWEACEL